MCVRFVYCSVFLCFCWTCLGQSWSVSLYIYIYICRTKLRAAVSTLHLTIYYGRLTVFSLPRLLSLGMFGKKHLGRGEHHQAVSLCFTLSASPGRGGDPQERGPADRRATWIADPGNPESLGVGPEGVQARSILGIVTYIGIMGYMSPLDRWCKSWVESQSTCRI